MSHLSQKSCAWFNAGLSMQSRELLVCGSANPSVACCPTVAQVDCVYGNTVVILE